MSGGEVFFSFSLIAENSGNYNCSLQRLQPPAQWGCDLCQKDLDSCHLFILDLDSTHTNHFRSLYHRSFQLSAPINRMPLLASFSQNQCEVPFSQSPGSARSLKYIPSFYQVTIFSQIIFSWSVCSLPKPIFLNVQKHVTFPH